MKYRFSERTRRDIASSLQGFERLAPSPDSDSLKRASVAIALVESAGAVAFVLTRRASRLRAHGGQWALPGGRCDDQETCTQTALRELDEEVGLRLGEDQVLGLLDDYVTRSGYLITPVVVWAGAAAELTPNPDEVASVHRIALDEIALHDAVDFITIEQSPRPVVRIRIEGNLIHAPTAALLYQFREVIDGRHTRVADLEQPVFAWR